MKVICTGSRNHNNKELIYHSLNIVAPTIVIVGDANGADRIVRIWCRENDVEWSVYYANWDDYGRAAGPIRNQRMLDEHPDADLVLAFPLEGSRGTWHMVDIAKGKVKIKVVDERVANET